MTVVTGGRCKLASSHLLKAKFTRAEDRLVFVFIDSEDSIVEAEVVVTILNGEFTHWDGF